MKIAHRALVLLAAAALPALADEPGPRVKRVTVEDAQNARVIVKYRADSTLMRLAARPQHAAVLGQRLGLPMADRWVLGARVQSLSAQGIGSAELARRLAAQPDVEWAEPVGRKYIAAAEPNDPYYKDGQTTITPVVGQWYLRAPDSTFLSATNAIGAWALNTGSAAITVAVLDTGVRFDHPDFRKADGTSKLYAGYDFVADNATSGDGTNGRDADATDPGDYTTASNSCGSGSSSWHGTQTAGIVGAASGNGVGMAGMGRDVMVLPVRVLGKCGGFDDDIQAAMLWAAGLWADGFGSPPAATPHPAQVINMSLGSTGACSKGYQDVFDRLAAAGVTVVVAAGNDEGLAVGTPANCRGALAVSGLRHAGTKVGFSNVGPEVAIGAPGGNCVNLTGACLYPILTTTNAGSTTPSTNTYSSSSDASVGTSFAAPQVAGAVALMLSADPTLTPATIKSVLQSTSRAFPAQPSGSSVPVCHAPNGSRQDECYCTTSTCGAGMLDVGAAVLAVTPSAIAPPAVRVQASTTTPNLGSSVALTSDGTAAFGGRSISSYTWAVTAGGTLASLSGSTVGRNATLVTTAAGSVTVQLTVVDTGGGSTSTSTVITVQDPAAVPVASGGGGGGGAFAAGWVALLGLAAAALSAAGRGRTPRRSTPA